MFGKLEEEKVAERVDIGADRGIIPRAIDQIFKQAGGSKSVGVFCSFLQIYNEKIYDLLQVGTHKI
jgi:GTP-sensing pleiotropic transcriptional regulator CodY